MLAAAAKAEAQPEPREQSPKRKKKGVKLQGLQRVTDVDALTLSEETKANLKTQLNVVWP